MNTTKYQKTRKQTNKRKRNQKFCQILGLEIKKKKKAVIWNSLSSIPTTT